MFQIEATVYPLSVEQQLALDAAVALIAGPEETWVVAPGANLLGAVQSHVRDSGGPVHIATLGVAPHDEAVQQLVGLGAEVFIVTDNVGLAVATAGGRVAYDALGAMICCRSGELALAIRERFAAVTEGLQPVALVEAPAPATTSTPDTAPADAAPVEPTTSPVAPETSVAPPEALPAPAEPSTAAVTPTTSEPPAPVVNPLDIPEATASPETSTPVAAPETATPSEVTPGSETASWSGEQVGGTGPA